MKPPIYSIQLSGSTPKQYLHRARQFRDAAMRLPDYLNGEQYWPKYALLTHAIKAFAYHSANSKQPGAKEPKQHDLLGWYKLAVHYGLEHDQRLAGNIELLNQLHMTHYTRYPQGAATPVPDASVIADGTVDDLIFTFTQAINPR